MVCELIDADICGGDWERIEAVYDLDRYAKLREHWDRSGPPIKIMIASYLGYHKAAEVDPSTIPKGEQFSLLESFLGSMQAPASGT